MSAAEKVAASPTAGLLHRYRTLAGLSQKELAERAGLSRRGISDLERGARRAAYPATLRRLVRALRLTDADETALLRARYGDASKLDAEAATTEPRPARVEWTAPGDDNPPSLPNELSSFVGRAQEVAEVLQLLGTTRLLTLVGAGGVGKTRLALRVAAIVAGDYADGVWLIDLAPLTDANLLIGVVATALRIQEQPGRALIEAIADVLRRRAVLLVLDNCEHLVQSCSEIIERLLSACPHLRVLATSRERMGLAGELTWRVPSLSIPGSEAPSNVDALNSHDATRLFMERARAVVPRLIFNDRDADRIIGLCRQLDGIPLAIELAAVHVQILSLAELSLRLGDQLHLLTGGMRTAPSRQQTLRAMRDWSYSPSQDHRREWSCLRFNGVTALIRGQSRS